VIFLQAEQKYVTVRHASGTMLMDESLKSLEQELSDLFIRIHRNALVARRCIAGLVRGADGATLVRLRGCDDHLPVSRRHLPELRRWLRGGSADQPG
jgi:two-component system response regulator AlgR